MCVSFDKYDGYDQSGLRKAIQDGNYCLLIGLPVKIGQAITPNHLYVSHDTVEQDLSSVRSQYTTDVVGCKACRRLQ